MILENCEIIKNSKNSEAYYLEPFLLKNRREDDLDRLVEICNQTEIYNALFLEMLNGKPYSKDNAEGFKNWADNGWKENQFFVFVLRNKFEQIVGCIDIKGNDIEKSEIGFWLDSTHSGIMTNALNKVLHIGDVNKFKILFGDAKPNNFKSINVMERNGFVFEAEVEGYLRFNKFI